MFHLLGLGVVASLKGAIVIIVLLAAVTMFLLARHLFGAPAALVAAVAYTYVPYHMLDLYVRKAFSELTVFAFLPALLLTFHNLRVRGSRWDLIAAALSLAAISTSHTISAMLGPPLLGAYCLFLSLSTSGAGRWKWLWKAAVSVVIGYAVAGFFLLPAVLERNDVNLHIYTAAYVNYERHFVDPRQLLWWPWGFGLSLDGLRDQMSFRLGALQIAGLVLAGLGFSRMRRRSRHAADHVAFFLALTAVALFMTTPASSAVWELLPPLKFVQFPWRFLTLTTLTTGLLCGAAFASRLPPAGPEGGPARRKAWLSALACSTAFPVAAGLGGTFGVHLRIPLDRMGFEERPYIKLVDRGPDAAPRALDRHLVKEHTLGWFDHLPAGVTSRDAGRADLDRPRVQVESGSATIGSISSRSWEVRFDAEVHTETRIRVNSYRFPGWTVRVDGSTVPLLEVPGQRRVIFFDLEPGRRSVRVFLERTPARLAGDLLTLLGLASLAAVGVWPGRDWSS